MPVLGTRGDALGEGAAPFRGEMPPLMLVNSAKRVVPDAHDGEVSSVCVDKPRLPPVMRLSGARANLGWSTGLPGLSYF